MRELKFRAWDKTRNEMHDVISLKFNYDGILESAVVIDKPFYDQRLIKADDLILEQFTGLHDENGKMIFDGDIVEHDVYHVGIKAYRSKSEVFVSDLGARIREDKNDEECSLLRHCTNIEFVGNIHENPELLGVGR